MGRVWKRNDKEKKGKHWDKGEIERDRRKVLATTYAQLKKLWTFTRMNAVALAQTGIGGYDCKIITSNANDRSFEENLKKDEQTKKVKLKKVQR